MNLGNGFANVALRYRELDRPRKFVKRSKRAVSVLEQLHAIARGFVAETLNFYGNVFRLRIHITPEALVWKFLTLRCDHVRAFSCVHSTSSGQG